MLIVKTTEYVMGSYLELLSLRSFYIKKLDLSLYVLEVQPVVLGSINASIAVY